VGVARGGVAWRSRDSSRPIKNLCNRTLLFTLLLVDSFISGFCVKCGFGLRSQGAPFLTNRASRCCCCCNNSRKNRLPTILSLCCVRCVFVQSFFLFVYRVRAPVIYKLLENPSQFHKNTADVAHNEKLKSLNEPFDLHELRRALRETKKHSAPGADRITYEMLQKNTKMLHKSSIKTI